MCVWRFCVFWRDRAIAVGLHTCSCPVCGRREYARSPPNSGQWCHKWERSEKHQPEIINQYLGALAPPLFWIPFLTRNRTLLAAEADPSTTIWWPLCHLKKSCLVAPSARQALWSLIRSLLTKRQWFPECSVA